MFCWRFLVGVWRVRRRGESEVEGEGVEVRLMILESFYVGGLVGSVVLFLFLESRRVEGEG